MPLDSPFNSTLFTYSRNGVGQIPSEKILGVTPLNGRVMKGLRMAMDQIFMVNMRRNLI